MTTHVESTDLDPLMQGEAALRDVPLSPQARLDASRAALQMWVTRTYHPERLAPSPDETTGRQAAQDDPGEPAWLGVIVDSLSDVPVASIAVRYMRRWWARHPLRATAEFADEAGREILGPTANKHPWLLLGGAVVAGAALSQLRPWRWVSGSALLASIIPPISLASVLTSMTALFHGLHPQPADDADGSFPPEGAAGSAAAPSQSQSQSQSAGERVAEPA